MKALVYEAPRVMTLREIDRPQPGRGEVLLRVAYSGTCGSELSRFLGQNSLRRPPLVFGHELSGVVEQQSQHKVAAASGLTMRWEVAARSRRVANRKSIG